jgi:hypothetical protein
MEGVAHLAAMTMEQISLHDIKEIHFYARLKDDRWIPYREALGSAVEECGIILHIHDIGNT